MRQIRSRTGAAIGCAAGRVSRFASLSGFFLAAWAGLAAGAGEVAFAHEAEQTSKAEHQSLVGKAAASAESGTQAARLPGFEAFPVEIGGPFALKDPEGHLHRDRDYRGRFMLVFFGYANCQGICPLGLRNMAQAHRLLGDAKGKVAPIFITVDPARDTPEALRDFVAETNPELIALSGSAAEVAEAREGYRIETLSLGGGLGGNEQFRHNTFIHLMGPDGKILTIFPPILDPERLAEAIRGYIEAVES